MNTPAITVYFDYVCPYCLLAEDTIATVAREQGALVERRPFELRRSSVYPMAEQLGVPITLPTVSPQPYTHTAFEGSQYARAQGRAEDYDAAVLEAFFQHGRDIGQLDVLTDIAVGVGLDADSFRTALVERRYAADHQAELTQARAAGIRAVPTVQVGPRRVEGVPTREQLRSALTE